MLNDDSDSEKSTNKHNHDEKRIKEEKITEKTVLGKKQIVYQSEEHSSLY